VRPPVGFPIRPPGLDFRGVAGPGPAGRAPRPRRLRPRGRGRGPVGPRAAPAGRRGRGTRLALIPASGQWDPRPGGEAHGRPRPHSSSGGARARRSSRPPRTRTPSGPGSGKGFPDALRAEPDLPGLLAAWGPVLAYRAWRRGKYRDGWAEKGPGPGPPAHRRPPLPVVPRRQRRRGDAPEADRRGAVPAPAGLGGRRLDDHGHRVGPGAAGVPRPGDLLRPPGLQLGDAPGGGPGAADDPGVGGAGALAQPGLGRQAGGGRRGDHQRPAERAEPSRLPPAAGPAGADPAAARRGGRADRRVRRAVRGPGGAPDAGARHRVGQVRRPGGRPEQPEDPGAAPGAAAVGLGAGLRGRQHDAGGGGGGAGRLPGRPAAAPAAAPGAGAAARRAVRPGRRLAAAAGRAGRAPQSPRRRLRRRGRAADPPGRYHRRAAGRSGGWPTWRSSGAAWSPAAGART
jgi:hypothetical protein